MSQVFVHITKFTGELTSPELVLTNIILSGPCGVGKTTVGPHLARLLAATSVDFDELRGKYLSDRRITNPLAFSVRKLDLMACLPAILACAPSGFVLAVGCGTVFNPNADNDARLADVYEFKHACSAQIVVVMASQEIVLRRYLSVPDRTEAHFETDWGNWLEIGEPYWKKCADLFVDSTFLAPKDTAVDIQRNLNRRIA